VSVIPNTASLAPLPQGLQVFERGWLSANNILLMDEASAVWIDSGYVSHAPQTLALVQNALHGRPLDLLLNTHLHSDHCGGNHALQNAYANLQTWIPPGLALAVSQWDETVLSYAPTGQECPRFDFHGLLQPGSEIRLAGMTWEIHAAPGHDPHSVIFFERDERILISADALWEHGFGVVFPELEGVAAFHEVGQTLDLIESLNPLLVIPGHGSPFRDCAKALQFARQKLAAFTRHPEKHARYGAKVLIKFKLLEWHQIERSTFVDWAENNQYLRLLQEAYAFGQPYAEWLDMILGELIKSQALEIDESVLRNI